MSPYHFRKAKKTVSYPCRYFEANPEDQKKFKKFANVAQASLADSTDFCAQTLTVMDFVETLVEKMGSNAASMMAEQKAPHTARGVGYTEFKVHISPFFYFPTGSFIGLLSSFFSFQKMFDLVPDFMAEHGADSACVDAWKTAAEELAEATK